MWIGKNAGVEKGAEKRLVFGRLVRPIGDNVSKSMHFQIQENVLVWMGENKPEPLVKYFASFSRIRKQIL